MSMVAAVASTDPRRRARLLKAMGVTPWRLRSGPDAASAAMGEAMPASPMAMETDAVCVVVIPAGCDERQLELIGRALRATGPQLARAARLEAGQGGLGVVPVARAYLVFGEAQAHALGHDLPAAVMSAADIVLVDEPARIVAEPGAKRRLWNGLRTLRRALAAG
ncbi:DNA polymerase III psi subunit [Luteibacter sp. Sphag1AF]|uniref:hypothetical protein n=1 Tax=Luteibacter sp. Sphag1AF TaxID=2587031 RepID=UPI001817BD5F|nr:hypothetical protein [Luteibacter sp. Sphag1AF]MBB3227315.1 DNA polymerase III psi subunit [Luteibacter sp. Sphag1AF]